MESWLLPITILPGVGLLILSTSNLMVSLSNEIDILLKKMESEDIISRKLAQLKLLNRAMVFFYLAVACLVVTGLISALSTNIDYENKIPTYTSILGIVTILLGIVTLLIYSTRAVGIRQDQFKNKSN